VVLTWLANDEEVEGYDIANTATPRAAKQQPKEMRLASMPYVKQEVSDCLAAPAAPPAFRVFNLANP
jgi:hypothetical protein